MEHGDDQISYGDLDRAAEDVAHRLRGRGVGAGSVVMTHLDRSIDLIVALLGIWRVGATYLPVEPSVPDQRLATSVKDADCTAVITRPEHLHRFAALPVVTVTPDPDPSSTGSSTLDRRVPARSSDAAYVIFTSGSSGAPKAVRVNHGSLAHLCRTVNQRYDITAADRVLQFAAVGFDTSIEQILLPLLHGATLVLPDYTWAPSELAERLVARRVSVMDLTPPYWRAFLAEHERAPRRLSVRLTIVGGSAVYSDDCRTHLRVVPQSRLVNAYGLTETTITSCTAEIDRDRLPPSGPAPVGTPLPGTEVLLLGPDLRPVPQGSSGEVHIAGPGLAHGYLTEERSEESRFVPAERSPHGRRLYRTGDLGHWDDAGELVVSGRVDRQVKIRGFRVEPGEVEAVLAGHELVEDVAVTTTADRGERQLVAYLTPTSTDRTPSAGELRAYLAARVPAHLVPAVFVPLAAMPTTTNGKIDLRALPAPADATARPSAEQGPTRAWSNSRWRACGGRSSTSRTWRRTTTSSTSAAIPCSPPNSWPRCAPRSAS